MRRTVAVFVVTALALGPGATARRADSLAKAPPAKEPVTGYLDELVEVEFTLVLPARVEASRSLKGALRLENTGPVTCLVPLDLRPSGGCVRLDWTGPDGRTITRGHLSKVLQPGSVALAPGAFYGQRFELGTTDPRPCVRSGDPDACDWPPGRYVFTATVQIAVDPAARPSDDAPPGLSSRSFTTDPVAVEVVK